MNTDLYKNIIRTLELNKCYMHNGKATTLFQNTFDAVSDMWENVDLDQYTVHGLQHSYKTITYFNQLKNLYEWSPYEQLIFAIAALIHDIGMQYNKWAPKRKGWPRSPLDEIDVRKKHAELGFKLVNEQINNKYIEKFPLCIYGTDKECYKTALYRAAYIGFSHTGQKILTKLSSKDWNDKINSNEKKFRPRLLAGILRLCDELDGNYTRISNPEKLNTWLINNEAKKHWLACLFIDDITVSIVNKAYVEILIQWRIPKNADNKLKTQIRKYITNFRELKINTEIKGIMEFLRKNNNLEYIKEFKIEFNEEPTKFIFTLNEPLKYMIFNISKTNMIQVSELTKLNKRETNNNEYLIKTSKQTITKGMLNPRSTYSLTETLESWFNRNKRLGHFVLINNEHTNIYLNCRSLVSNQDLLRYLSDYISKIYIGKNINCILAVGTSAIPLAVNLAYRLKCSVTYTVSRIKLNLVETVLDPKINDDYFPFEIIPNVKKGQNVLVVDDVISSGRVLKDVLFFINKRMKIKLGTIYHQAIFRLGNRIYKKSGYVRSIRYIIHIPDVLYANNSSVCPLCKKGIPVEYEVKMY